ncbi:TIL domain-containing protein [Caenorhabditis elegans]|uniref:TIL domain-containing protein n=1 Tax=Caenorhabditis elegans TaxID=6239 RepID=A0A1N7SYS4_CAEEL|nr:TIL domain-containing protein [Caenorhabditis elegans]SIT60441.1 TIL domain-containing protein [Caenorhabditis elegans]|eukprot:NP_001335551.1 Uncharacterized protein CELE_C04E6.12 [Caenorhabditis elegans]
MKMMLDTYSQIFIISIVLFLIPYASSVLNSNSIDWCEYWARVANQNEFLKTDRPECTGYELPSGLKRSDTFSCSKTEIYHCLDCEPTCHNLIPKCRKEQCNKGCVCKTGLARNAEGKCVTLRECASQSPPKNDSIKGDEDDGTVMKTVKKMVPVIVNDVWKALFNSISTPDSPSNKSSTKTDIITPVLTPVDPESKKMNISFPSPRASEITDDKQQQKGFYIDYP